MHPGIEWCRCIEAFVGFTIDLFPPKRCWCNNINDRKTFYRTHVHMGFDYWADLIEIMS